MITASNAFRRQLTADNRNYKYKITVNLADDTLLKLTEEDIWDGSLTLTEGTSSSDSFDLGGTVIGQCKLVLNNIYEKFTTYNFFNAVIGIEVGLSTSENTVEYIRKGFYTVNSADYNGSLITITADDNMWKFDVPFSGVNNSYPISASSLVMKICEHCGVVFTTGFFNNSNYKIQKPKEDVEMNCREVLGYIGQICCTYFKVSNSGYLEAKWYEKDLINAVDVADGGSYFYGDGDDADGGSFAYDDGVNLDGGSFLGLNGVAYLTSNSSMSVGTDPILITGVRTLSQDTDDPYDYLDGEEGYVLTIENNPFISEGNAKAIAKQVADIVVGTLIRTFESSTLSDPTYQAGDVCAITDFRGHRFYSFITNCTFTGGNYETFSCGAIPPNQANTVRYSEAVKTAVQIARKTAEDKITSYDTAVQQMNALASNAMGLRWLEVKDENGDSVFLMSNKPIELLEDNTVKYTLGAKVWKMSGEGFFICNNAKIYDPQTWISGWDGDGNVVTNTIATIGLDFDWATGRTLNMGGRNNGDGEIIVRNSNNTEIGRWDKDGINISNGVIDGVEILSKGSDDRFVRMNDGSLQFGYTESGTRYAVGGLEYKLYYDGDTARNLRTIFLGDSESGRGVVTNNNRTCIDNQIININASSSTSIKASSLLTLYSSRTANLNSEGTTTVSGSNTTITSDNTTRVSGGNTTLTSSGTTTVSGDTVRISGTFMVNSREGQNAEITYLGEDDYYHTMIFRNGILTSSY